MEDLQKRIKRMRRWYRETKKRYYSNLSRVHAFIYYLYSQENYSRKELAKLFDLTSQRIGQIILQEKIKKLKEAKNE